VITPRTRIALLSDVHANLPALEAVLDDIATRVPHVDAAYHLGDLVGYAPWPDEVIALLRERGITGVAGNYDSTVAMRYAHCGCGYEDPEQQRLAHISFAWTLDRVSATTRATLAALPFRMDVRPAGGHVSGPTLTLVHGTPTLNTLYWTETRPDEFCSKMARIAGRRGGDVIAFGHTHVAWTRVVDGVRFVNTGSVGRPKDGDWRAGYVRLELDGEGGSLAEFVRIPYDVDRAIAGIRASGLPPAFGEHLRTGGRA